MVLILLFPTHRLIDNVTQDSLQEINQAAMQSHYEAQKHLETNSQALRRQILLYSLVGAGILALITIPFGLWLASTISRPLEHLIRGMQQVGKGDFDSRSPGNGVQGSERYF